MHVTLYLSSPACYTPHGPICANALDKTMRLTNFSDFALRLLMYAAAREDRLITIEEASEVYQYLAHAPHEDRQYADKGRLSEGGARRSGGLALAKPPHKIKLGDVIRTTGARFRAGRMLWRR